VRSPCDLCILLPEDLDDPEIRIPVDQDVVRIVESMTLPSPFVLPSDSVEMGEPGFPAAPSINPLDAMSSDDDSSPLAETEIPMPDFPDDPPRTIVRSADTLSRLLGADGDILNFDSLGPTEVS
jgi:hypothetical protein